MKTFQSMFYPLFIIGILSFYAGYKYNIPTEHTSLQIKEDTIYIEKVISQGTEQVIDSVFIHDTTIIKDTSPCCIPYQTFREDSILKIWVTSFPYQRKNIDSVFIKPYFITYHDTVSINTYIESSLQWYYYPVLPIVMYLEYIAIKK